MKSKKKTKNKLYVTYPNMRKKMKAGDDPLLWNIFHRVDMTNKMVKTILSKVAANERNIVGMAQFLMKRFK